MYCIHCGVKLADSEKACPLCGTVPYHPDIPRPDGEPLYPAGRKPKPQVRSQAAQIVVTALFLLPMLITLQVDLLVNRSVTWSGYVSGAVILAYVLLVAPFWFRHPNPVVFVPCDFAVLGLYLLYINFTVSGDWFLTFAFPVVAYLGLILTAVVALVKYVGRGLLYIFGGASLLTGLFMPVMEFLVNLTFHRDRFLGWSIYPLTALLLLGGTLIFLALNKRAREKMERKFFI